MKQGRVTTREFYEELQQLNDRRSVDMEMLRSELQQIGSRVENLVDWAYGSEGERGIGSRLRSLEDMHVEERGMVQQRDRSWRLVQQIIAFTIGILGAVIGAVL